MRSKRLSIPNGRKYLLYFLILVLGFSVGLFFILFDLHRYDPIKKEDAITYTGTVESIHLQSKDYKYIRFTDGSEYFFYPHTSNDELIKTIEKGTEVQLRINPKTNDIIELNAGNKEIMNLESSQNEIYRYTRFYVYLGFGMCSASALVAIYYVAESISVNRDKKAKVSKKRDENTSAVGKVDLQNKSRVLLKTKIGDYNICYHRVKHTNQLVVNGYIYDQKRSIIEFPHTLIAIIDGNLIEAGLDEDSVSFISFNGKTKARKKRII